MHSSTHPECHHRCRHGPGKHLCGGRYWVRTSDLFGVNEARYHCANRPRGLTIADPSGCAHIVAVGRGAHCSVCLPRRRVVIVACAPRPLGSRKARGRGSVGRASPCQGEGRGFESRRPLGVGLVPAATRPVLTGGVAERRGNGLQIRVHGFKSRLHLGRLAQLVARFPDTEEVISSSLVSPTRAQARFSEPGLSFTPARYPQRHR